MPGYSDLSVDTLALHSGAAPGGATDSRAVPIELTTSFVLESSERAALRLDFKRAGGCAHASAGRPTRCKSSALLHSKAAQALRPAAKPHCVWRRRCGGALQTTALPAPPCVAACTTCGTTPCAGLASTPLLPRSATLTTGAQRYAPASDFFLAKLRATPAQMRRPWPWPESPPWRRQAGGPRLANSTLTLHWLIEPFEHGADRAFRSAAQFLSGHGAVTGGRMAGSGSFGWDKSGKFTVLSAATDGFDGFDSFDGFEKVVFCKESTPGAFLLRVGREGRRDFGACASPRPGWLILQGIQTLGRRLTRRMSSTQKGVAFLASPFFVSRVGQSLLAGHLNYTRVQQQLACSARLAFSFNATAARARGKALVQALKMSHHHASPERCRSRLVHPASTTDLRLADDAPVNASSTLGTCYLSSAPSQANDLLDGLNRALKSAEKTAGARHEMAR